VACPQCEAQVQGDAEFCPKCGQRLIPQKGDEAEATAATTPRRVVRERCPKCRTILQPQAEFCPTCGVKLRRPQSQASAQRFCSACGAEMKGTARFCPICGQAAQ
jgi:RNA polymerase subunit RPABC4/transcription elongation factor Spt4